MMNATFRMAMAAILLGLGFLSFTPDAAAQTAGEQKKTRTRLADSGRLYRDGLPAYHTQYPALRQSPVTIVDIPRNVRSAYLYLDTLMRAPEGVSMFQKIDLKTLNARALTRLTGLLYQMNDYNPVLYSQYVDGNELRPEENYRFDLRRFSDAVYGRFREQMNQQGPASYALLYADYILRVKIHAVEPSFDEGQLESQFYRVTAEVMDTVKGHYFQPYERSSLAAYVRPWAVSTIQFQYTPDNYMQISNTARDRDEVKFPYSRKDPAFTTGDGRFGMTPGQEAIIFLRHDGRLVDADHDYYYLHLEPWASYNALPVLDGMVRDVNTIWSDRELLSYNEWRSRFQLLRGQIVSAEG